MAAAGDMARPGVIGDKRPRGSSSDSTSLFCVSPQEMFGPRTPSPHSGGSPPTWDAPLFPARWPPAERRDPPLLAPPGFGRPVERYVPPPMRRAPVAFAGAGQRPSRRVRRKKKKPRDAARMKLVAQERAARGGRVEPSYTPQGSGKRWCNPIKVRIDTISSKSQEEAEDHVLAIVAKRLNVGRVRVNVSPRKDLDKRFFFDAYVEFSSAADAALAISRLHGRTVQEGCFPVRVMYAWER